MAPDYRYIASLFRKLQQGDETAFADFYAATFQQQYRYAYGYLKDSHLAQDAVQEAYLIAYKGANSLLDPTLCIAWLKQITFRVCFRMFRKQARCSVVPDETLMLREATGNGSHPEDELVQVETSAFMLKRILSLPENESQVIFLHYYRHLKLQQVADMLDVSLSTVKRYQKSGLTHLKEVLVEDAIVDRRERRA